MNVDEGKTKGIIRKKMYQVLKLLYLQKSSHFYTKNDSNHPQGGGSSKTGMIVEMKKRAEG